MRYLPAIVILLSLNAGAVTLDEAVGIALENRGDVQSALMSYESAVWTSRSADLWFLPQVNGQFAFSKNYDVHEMTIPGMGSFPMGTEYSSIAGVSVTVPLFVPQGPAGSRLASRAEELSLQQSRAAEMDAVVHVVQVFYGVLLAQEMMDVSVEALNIAEAGYELAVLRYNAGMISRFELLQSRVAWENRIPILISAENSVKNAFAGFAVALGQESDAHFLIEGSLDDEADFKIPETLDEAREAMHRNNPDLQAAEYIELVGDAGVDMARASFLPRLVFQTDLDYIAARNDTDFEIDDYDRNLVVSVALQIPLFNGYSDISDYNSARAERVASEASARSIRQFTDLSLVSAWNILQAAREGVIATYSTVEQAIEGASIAAISFEAGMITRLEMDQSFLALTTARTNHANALYIVRIAEAELMRAAGLMEGYLK